MYLVDSNIWLEMLLAQPHAEEARNAISRIPRRQLAISDFSLFSIGIILFRLKQSEAYKVFVREVVSRISVLRLDASEFELIDSASKQFKLDFDDAYQYVLAQKFDLILISFDHDFDQTLRGRRTPAQVIQDLNQQDDSGITG
jgi:uncharacterized protein